MAVLDNKFLKIIKFFDIQKDPYELVNIKNSISYKNDIKKLIDILYKNRKEVFDIKGVKNLLNYVN